MKRASDGLFLLAVLLLVLAITQSSRCLYVLAGTALVGSIVTTSIKRRREKIARPSKP